MEWGQWQQAKAGYGDQMKYVEEVDKWVSGKMEEIAGGIVGYGDHGGSEPKQGYSAAPLHEKGVLRLVDSVLKLHSKFHGKMHSTTIKQIRSLEGACSKVRVKENGEWVDQEVPLSRDGMSCLECVNKLKEVRGPMAVYLRHEGKQQVQVAREKAAVVRLKKCDDWFIYNHLLD